MSTGKTGQASGNDGAAAGTPEGGNKKGGTKQDAGGGIPAYKILEPFAQQWGYIASDSYRTGLTMAETAELLARARAGDAEAFCELAEACEGQLFRQAVALCRDATTAEDLTSETLIEAWKSVGRFNGQCRFSTWLYAILLHRYQKLVRRAQSRPVEQQGRDENSETGKVLEQVPDTQPNPEGLLAQQELCAGLREAMESLPEEHAEVVRLRFYQEASLAEIAAALDLPVGTVKSRLHHALEKLRGMKFIVNLLKELGDK